MAYNVVYKKSVLRDLERLRKDEARRLLDHLELLDQLEKDLSEKPDSPPALKGQFKRFRRHRVGDDRIIYTILSQDVVILRIGSSRGKERKGI